MTTAVNLRNAGRKPLPSNVHVLNGNPSKKSQAELDAPELELDETMPEPPAEVLEQPEALAEWNRIVPQLHAAGIIRAVDQTSLSTYCCTYAEWIKALAAIRKSRVIRTNKGELKVNPMFKVMTDCSKQMARYLVEFGLTPSSRVRFKGNGPKKQNDPDSEMFGD